MLTFLVVSELELEPSLYWQLRERMVEESFVLRSSSSPPVTRRRWSSRQLLKVSSSCLKSGTGSSKTINRDEESLVIELVLHDFTLFKVR